MDNDSALEKTTNTVDEKRTDPWGGISLQTRDGWNVISHNAQGS